MSISKLLLSEKLIEGYIKTPPLLKEQALTKLAIYLCQFFQLKKDIICASNALTVEVSREKFPCYRTWEDLIETQSKAMCEKLSLAPALSSALIVCIRSIALELFSWNKQHQTIFHTSAYVTDQFLTLSDWTIEGRLDETKIAERLVQEEKIPVCRRYRLACIHSLEPYIFPLWNQTTLEQQKGFCSSDNLGNGKESGLVKLKSYHLAGKLQELIDDENLLWQHQLKKATEEGARTAFVNFWKTLNESQRQEVIIPVAIYALSQSANLSRSISRQAIWMNEFLENRYHKQPVRPAHYSDILYFLLSQMSQEQRISFFRQAIQTHRQAICAHTFNDCIFSCFLQWPYQDFFISIITKLWGILSEDRYAQQLLMLAHRYANRDDERREENEDYSYGGLLVELLEQTPEHYKRYIFNIIIPELGATWGWQILLELINKWLPYEYKDIKIFQRFLRQATPEEKNSIIYSQHGEKLCSRLIRVESLELLEYILNECLTKEAAAHFKKRFLLSDQGKNLCFELLKREGESAVNLFLNWGCLSEEEISAFKSEVFFRRQGTFSRLLEKLETNQLDRLMWRCLPSQAEREQYKQELIEEIGMDVCTHFIMFSKWEGLTQFLNWCFSSEEAIERFKQEFLAKEGIPIHGALTLNQQWKDAEQFFAWCRLSPMAIEQLKKDIFSSSEFLVDLCDLLNEGDRLEDIARCLSWNLVDREAVIACDEAFKKNKPVEFYRDYTEDEQQLIQRNWDTLIKEILCEKSEQDHKTQKGELELCL